MVERYSAPAWRKRMRKKAQMLRKDQLLYFMVIPGLVYFILFKYVPMYGITIAFRNFNIFKGYADAPWVGFAVFQRLFGLRAFGRAMTNTVIISFFKMLFGFPAPILLSLLMNEVTNQRYKKFIQTSVLLPSFISWVVISSLMYLLFSPNTGVIKSVYEFLGLASAVPDLLGSKSSFRQVLIISDIWKGMGMGTIVYMAAISGIDPQLYEAATIDGAGKGSQIWHVTLPGLRATIVIMLIMRCGTLLDAGFDQIFTLQNPLVYDVSEIIDTYVYKIGILDQKFSLATAAGVFKSFIGLVMVLITNAIATKIDPDSALI